MNDEDEFKGRCLTIVKIGEANHFKLTFNKKNKQASIFWSVGDRRHRENLTPHDRLLLISGLLLLESREYNVEKMLESDQRIQRIFKILHERLNGFLNAAQTEPYYDSKNHSSSDRRT